MALQAVRAGALALARAWRLLPLYWLATALFALAAAVPAVTLLAGELGHSLYADKLMAGFDPQWVAEWLLATRGAPALAAPALLLVVAAGYLLLSTFLAGGAITVLAPGGGLFWEACGRHFARLLRLLPISGVFYLLVFALMAALARVPAKLWADGGRERPFAIFAWCQAALLVLLFALVNMVFDYAKIRLVLDDSRQAARAALGSFRLVFRHFFPAAATYALIAGLALAVPLLWAGVSALLPRTALGWLLLALAAQQVFVLARIAVKLLFFSAQLGLYANLRSSSLN